MLDQKLTKFIEVDNNESEDWTFSKADTKYLTHGFHPYPARMIPQVAGRLIDHYSNSKGTVCIDPFCGSGTVLVESKLRNIQSIGVDNNPLAVLISKVKTTPIPTERLSKQRSVISQQINENATTISDLEVPQIKNLDYWFKTDVSKLLALIKKIIDTIDNQDVADYFKVCFSIAVRKVSNTRPGEFKLFRIPEDKLKSYKPNVLQIFLATVDTNIHKMDEFVKYTKPNNAPAIVIKGDTRFLININKKIVHEDCANLLVTSPPYGDAHTTVAYGQFSRYPAAWLGFNEEEVWNIDKNGLGGKVLKNLDNLESPTLENTIGLIAKSDNFRARETYSFFHDMDQCFSQISKVMQKGKSHICFVLGNRTVKRIRIPSDTILIELGKKYGFKHLDTKYRNIPSKHMPITNAPENIASMRGETMSKESIVIWKY